MQNQKPQSEPADIDPSVNEIFTQSQALDYCRQITGKRPAPSTWHRWKMKGVSGIRLETILINGNVLTSREALVRFFQASAIAKNKRHSQSTSAGIKKAKRMRDSAAARAEFDAHELGI